MNGKKKQEEEEEEEATRPTVRKYDGNKRAIKTRPFMRPLIRIHAHQDALMEKKSLFWINHFKKLLFLFWAHARRSHARMCVCVLLKALKWRRLVKLNASTLTMFACCCCCCCRWQSTHKTSEKSKKKKCGPHTHKNPMKVKITIRASSFITHTPTSNIDVYSNICSLRAEHLGTHTPTVSRTVQTKQRERESGRKKILIKIYYRK